ncbi:sensor histidine kinase [Plebeiibacterium sediminum]|uniref:histidine kinase n=1 Tax=Plebeiibacterium sediminum TaxID=2992112 RepID=A0AAE3SFF1_9BACT|nr:ATP-binding protein [Plebeiobacterium sediminum]MCW3787363.1 ATP-binding protein [Plebeiobacterium sediminum]
MRNRLLRFVSTWQVLLLVVTIVVTMLFSWAYYNYNNNSFSSLRFQNILQQQVVESEQYVKQFKSYLIEGDEWKAVDTTMASKPKGIEILVYKNDSLCCWTNQVLPFRNEDVSILKNKVAQLANTWYLIKQKKYKQWDVFCLVAIKTEYSYNNEFLKEEFAIDIPVAFCKKISVYPDAKGEKVYDIDGNYLFTAQDCDQSNPTYANWGIVFLLLSIILYIQVCIVLIKLQKESLYSRLFFLATIIISAVFYWIHIHFQVPHFLFDTYLFSPVYFGATELFPNLGSVLLFAILVFSEAFIFYKYVLFPGYLLKLNQKKFYRNLIIAGAIAAIFGFWHMQNYIVKILVSNSLSAPILFKVSDIHFLDIVRFFIISLLLLSAVLVMEKVFIVFLKQVSKNTLSVIVFIVAIVLALYSFSTIFWVYSFMFLVVANMLIWVTRRKSYHAYSTFVWFVAVFSVFSVYSFYFHNYNKEREERKLLIENLSFRLSQEEDPLSELLLKELEDALSTDSIIKEEILKKDLDIEGITKYLRMNYFQGYLERYELQVIPCWPGGDVFIDSENQKYNCYEYFDNMLQKDGSWVLGSKHFHFLKNQAGLVTYFGVFEFNEGDPVKETCLYLEMVSKPFFEGPGYPELLLSERESKLKEPLTNYSYAKYIDGQLAKQVGEFAYPIQLSRLTTKVKNFRFFKAADFSHLVYQPQENVCVVLSLPIVNFSMILIAFSILFVAFFIFGSFLILLTRLRRGRLMYDFTVQERIQIAFIGLMMALLLIIASGSVWQTIRRFEVKNNQILSEKIRSVLMELEHKIGSEDELTPDMEEYLEYLLKKFSSVFYTDLNMYGTDGRLIATSRPELFDKGLYGHLMNSRGYIELNRKGEIEFIHEEAIGSLRYLSVYVPFINEDNKVLAYLNMPYFVGTSELRDEISSLVMGIVNFYLIFLIIVIGLTVVVSRKITHPLKVIQSKMGNLSLDKRNEKIEYKGRDEIGQLVIEYNRMVDELSESAEKLAKSEREMAWREMARQIAHEIKNPLTPMKLSIQYLERANKDKASDFDGKLKKVSATLIDQIDNLSSIASEFSNFAKMPIAKRKRIDVVEVLLQCVSLFDKSSNLEINVNQNNIERYWIFADPEQMNSVFNNLLKNAIQSIPSKRKGIITVDIQSENDRIVIKITDNGLGIDEEIQGKLFSPNFTTKSGGMGLGLAIVKNIVVNSKGKIWFKTQLDKGTSFFVEFPRYDE